VATWVVHVELQAVKSELSVVEEVERGEGDALVLRHVAHIEVTLAAIEPRERVAGAVELGKLQLVHH
jgi:hypothetical protein